MSYVVPEGPCSAMRESGLPPVPRSTTEACPCPPYSPLMAAATLAALLSAGVKLYLLEPITRLYVLRLPVASAVAFQEAAERLRAGICCVWSPAPSAFWRSRVVEPFMGPGVVLWSEMR